VGRMIYFSCPTDQDEILFEEDLNSMKFVMAERPKTCRRCGKSYYKWECVERTGDEAAGPGNNRRNP
jgi:hypothetical protein